MPVIQTLKLGLAAFETTLPYSSTRIFSGPNIEEISKTGRSVNGTLKKHVVSKKRSYTITYNLLEESDVDIIDSIYQLQITYPETELSFIYTNESGAPVNVSVNMLPVNRGALKPLDKFYYENITIELTEV